MTTPDPHPALDGATTALQRRIEELTAERNGLHKLNAQLIAERNADLDALHGQYKAKIARLREELESERYKRSEERGDLIAERAARKQAEASHPKCGNCGKLASCMGSYENDESWAYACDECCGHGCEDGRCYPLEEIPQRYQKRGEQAERERDTALAGRDAWHQSSDAHYDRAIAAESALASARDIVTRCLDEIDCDIYDDPCTQQLVAMGRDWLSSHPAPAPVLRVRGGQKDAPAHLRVRSLRRPGRCRSLAEGAPVTLQESVRNYLDHGFRPVPMWGVDERGECLCGGKLPDGKPCRAGKHSPEPVETEWKERRYGPRDFEQGMNLALALGPWKPGKWLVCLDFDGVQPGEADLPFFRLPETLTQHSPRGVHVFFTVPEFEPLGNWTDVFQTKRSDGVALDIRYARGRINAAPSRTAFGGYHWTNWRAPAPLPPEVTERIYDQRRARGLPVLSSWDRGEKVAGV